MKKVIVSLGSRLVITTLLLCSSALAADSLTTYTYLKSNQQTAVLGYLDLHNLVEDDVIPFYYSYHPYYIFANTYMPGSDVNQGEGYLIDGEYWKTTEHYFQAMKFPGNPSYQNTIKQAPTGGAAAKLGKANKPGKDKNWYHVKKAVMHTALIAKFSQDATAQATLLGTGDKILIEAAAGSTNFNPDFTWGIGDDGSGSNWLGELLMQVRDALAS